jgi:hypothetical protein
LRVVILAVFCVACASQGGNAPRKLVIGTIPDPEDAILKGPEAQTSADGLVRTAAPDASTLVFIKPPRPHLQRYAKMMLGNVRIAYKAYGEAFDQRTELSLRESLREKIRREMLSRELWTISDEPGDDVLLIRVSVLDTDVKPKLGGDGSSTTFAAGGGGAVLVLEVLRSVEPEPLVRIIQRRQLEGGVYGGSQVDYTRLKQSFRGFAESSVVALQRIYEGQRQIGERDRQRESSR